MNAVATGPCACCGTVGVLVARGLIQPCYHVQRRRGKLDAFSARKQPRATRGTRITWTPQRERQLTAALQGGARVSAIARLWGCRREAIYAHLYGEKRTVGELRKGVRTLAQVARIFGVGPATVRRWITAGWMKTGVGVRMGTQQTIFITDASLRAFLRLCEAWTAWTPERMTDPAWRDLAHLERRRARGRWRRVCDVLEEQGFSRDCVAPRVKRGCFPGAIKVHGTWYTWEDSR